MSRNIPHSAFICVLGVSSALLCGTVLLNGCYFDRVEKSEESDIQRVQEKQATLQAEQDRAARLKHQKDELVDDLSEHELSWNELNGRVEALNSANAGSIAESHEKRVQYERLLEQLHQTNDQLARLRHGDGAVSAADRQAQIAALRSQLKTELDRLWQ